MQRRPKPRHAFLALATVLFLAVSFHSKPSDPAIPSAHEIPTASEVPRTEDVAHWLATGAMGDSSAPSGFHAFHAGDLSGELAGRRRLELFPTGPEAAGAAEAAAEAQRRFLYRMPYGAAIAIAAQRHHADGLLLAAVVAVESGFAPHAESPRGALGLMQVTPEVGEGYGARDLFDPYVNVDVGCRYLCSLLKGYDGNLERALAAYNAGPGAVDRYRGVPPYAETRSFVREVLDLYAEYGRKAGLRRLGA
ncbi:MAG TPA: lytic transglycosylase domain-containing protein [Thermoanaerobaculia bacterium]|jgi:hypothetical protein|nr:lytic transglycosylase domain-containing protein [Thermoanaerobaculia bacterium]